MTPAILPDLSTANGGTLLAYGCTALCLLVGLVIAGVEYIPRWLRYVRREATRLRVRLILRDGAIPFDQRKSDGSFWPLVATLAFTALVACILWQCK